MKIVNVLNCTTDIPLLTFEAESIYLATPFLFFADGKRFETRTEVFIETIDHDGLHIQQQCACPNGTRILGASHTKKRNNHE